MRRANDVDASHFFVAKDGCCEQYKEIGAIVFSVEGGSGSMPTYEPLEGLQHLNELAVDGLDANQTVWIWQQRTQRSRRISKSRPGVSIFADGAVRESAHYRP